MNKGLKWGLGLIAATACGQAAAEPEPYVLGALGSVQMSDDSVSYDGASVGYRLGAGVGLTKNAAVELTYTDYGQSHDEYFGTKIELETTAVTLSILGRLAVNESLTVLGRLGLARWDSTARIDAFSVSASEEGTDPVYGLGVEARFSRPLSARLEFETGDFDGVEHTLVSASIVYRP